LRHIRSCFFTPATRRQAIAIPLLAYIAFFQLFATSQVVIVNALRGYKIAFIPMLVYTTALWGIGLGGGYELGLDRLEARICSGLLHPWARRILACRRRKPVVAQRSCLLLHARDPRQEHALA